MENIFLLNQLEEELNEMKAFVSNRPTYKIDNAWLVEEKRKVSNFNQSFYYKPAEVGTDKNLLGIKKINEGKYQTAENYFKEAISYFNHPLFNLNLKKCYELQNRKIDFEEELVSSSIGRLMHAFKNEKDSFLNLSYINIDQIDSNDNTAHLQGYDFVFELIKSTYYEENTVLILNVPYVIWKEFYSRFLFLYLNEPNKYRVKKIIDDGEVFLYEVRNRNSHLVDNTHEQIPHFPLVEMEILTREKQQFLNSYKNFIFEFYLKNYVYSYQEPFSTEDNMLYFQIERENEQIYGHLKSAIFNLKNNIPNPLLKTNKSEYSKGIGEYRSFFPEAFTSEIILHNYMNETIDEKLFNKIANLDFKEDISRQIKLALKSIVNETDSIPTHLRKSLEVTFKHIIYKIEKKVDDSISLGEMISMYATPTLEHKELSEYMLDVLSMENLQVNNGKSMKSKTYKKTLYELKRTTNKKIHFDWSFKVDSMKSLTQKEALNLFLKTVDSIEALIKEYKL